MKDILGLRDYAEEHITSFPRKEVSVYYACHAPEFLFSEEWDELSEEAKEFYGKFGLGCEGTGNISSCCDDCPFLKEDWEDI